MRTEFLELGRTIRIPVSDLITAILGLCLLVALALVSKPQSILFSDASAEPGSGPPTQQVSHRP